MNIVLLYTEGIMAPNSPTTGQVAAKSLVQSIALEPAMGAKDKLIGSSARLYGCFLLTAELPGANVRL